MPSKEMRTVFFKQSPYNSPTRSPLQRHTFSDTMVDEDIDNARLIISKWESSSDHSTSTSYRHDSTISHLFSGENRDEAKQYLKSVNQLQSAMHHYINDKASMEKVVRAQNLMQTAMKKLQREFYNILKSNRDYLNPESVSTHSSRTSLASLSDLEEESEEDDSGYDNSISEVERVSMLAMADLNAIADCMIASGYGKECVKIYKIIRKSIIDEALYHLGVDRLSFSQIQKKDWEVIEIKIRSWLHANKIAVKTLFYGERILCDHVFSSSPAIREAVFADITRDGALALFGFPENVAKGRKTPEKMFRMLDLYESVSDLWPEIDSIFNLESCSAVRQQAINSLIQLAEAVRSMLVDFESAISKDNPKTPVPGGGVHPLTRYVMNYVTFLTDYSGLLADIVADWPLTNPSPLPETYFGSPVTNGSYSSAISVRLAWILLVLICKLDGKSQLYKDVALSYLFLANNLQYIVNKVRTSNLKLLLGEEWVFKHEEKVKQYASNYERMAWSKVLSMLPENLSAEMTLDQVTDIFRGFNGAFEDVYKKQASWIVQDSQLRDEIKVSVAQKLVPRYRELYEKYREVFRRDIGGVRIVRFAPEDLGNYLSDLLHGTGGLGSGSSVNSSVTSSFCKGGRSR